MIYEYEEFPTTKIEKEMMSPYRSQKVSTWTDPATSLRLAVPVWFVCVVAIRVNVVYSGGRFSLLVSVSCEGRLGGGYAGAPLKEVKKNAYTSHGTEPSCMCKAIMLLTPA